MTNTPEPSSPPRVDEATAANDTIEAELKKNLDRVVNTGSGGVIGLDKCPKCGSAEIDNPPGTDGLSCLFCRHTWTMANADSSFGFDSAIQELRGTVTTTGAADIDREFAQAMTIKCGGCGAEVVVNTESKLQARCHWCRQTLSVNEQIPNGAVPDAVLPFKLTKDEAVKKIHDFAGKREFFAHKQFRKEFKPDNIMGVYLPYMIVDGNVAGKVTGEGEIQTRRYTRKVGKSSQTYYDADVYQVERAFDYTVDDLHVESSTERAAIDVQVNTNNILNAILPFDTKNAVTFYANYLGDYTSEKRDLDLADLKPKVAGQLLTIARSEATRDANAYGRGIRWETESLEVKGSRWVSIYVPVWLYSYYEDRGEGRAPFIHYIAVNARNGKTMGSVPVNKPLLLGVSIALGSIIFALSLPLAIAGFGSFGSTDDGAAQYENSSPAPSGQRYDPNDRFNQ